MRVKRFFGIVFLLFLSGKTLFAGNGSNVGAPAADTISVLGKVTDRSTGSGIPAVKVSLPALGLDTRTDENGVFVFHGVPLRRAILEAEHSDYFPYSASVSLADSIMISLKGNSIELQEFVVIGKEQNANGVTGTNINRKAIEHLQATSLQEVLQLVPGNLVTNPGFSNTARASLRQYESSNFGSMGTAVIMNGATLSNNANLQAINTATAGGGAGFSTSSGAGVDLRAITADNIASVEVIRGVPSVEYGDLSSGAIIVRTKARKEPLQVKARFNPTLTQLWAGKGFGMKDPNEALYVDVDYTDNLDSEINKYRTYRRATGTIQYFNIYQGRFRWHSNSTLALGFSRDRYGLDPDYVVDSARNEATEKSVRLSTTGVVDISKKWSRSLEYLLAFSYTGQKGYQQQQYTADITAESYALTNSTNEVPYLRSTYLSRMWVEGKPVNLNMKIVNSAFFLSGASSHNVLAGLDYRFDVNYGSGKVFTRPPRNTSGAAHRERPYDDIPALSQLGMFVQDKISRDFGSTSLTVIAGLRYDWIQPFRSDYSLHAVSPRVNAAYKVSPYLSLRAAYGVTVKAPTLLYLYPENAYFDFFSLNYYATDPNERLAIVTTRVYDSRNSGLRLARTHKKEVGADIRLEHLNNARLSLTVYREKTPGAYSMSTSVGSVQFARYPLYSAATGAPGQRPVITDTSTSIRFVSYYMPTNNSDIENSGIEFDLDLGRFNAINTSFHINGAYTKTRVTSNSEYIFQRNLADRPTTRIGVFAAGRGSIDERLVSTVRAIHHIPKLRFVITLTAQTIWIDRNRYTGYSSYPVGYIPFDAENGRVDIRYLTDEERKAIDPEKDADIYLVLNPAIFTPEAWKPLWLFNFKLTKEFRKGLSFSFFANNFINSRPLQNSTRYPNVYTMRNISLFFGSEISIKF